MQLIELGEQNKSEYNAFVATHESGSFLQSWEWGEWQARLGRAVCRCKIIDDSENQIASIQLITTPLPFGKYYLYAPYGPVTDLKFNPPAGKAGIEDLRFLTQELQKKFSGAIFIRIEPKSNLLSINHYPLITKSANIQPGKTLVLDLTKPEDRLLSEMHHKTRYNIKLAQKHGVEVQGEFGLTIGKGLYAREAIGQIAQTAERQNYKAQNLSYFEKLVDFFAVQNNQTDLKLHIYKALYQKQLLACAIMIDFGTTRTYLFGGSSDSHREVMAPYLLHWKAICDAKAQGLKYYDFWGVETASGDTPGFARFKMGFGGEVVSYPGAWDIAGKNFWYKSYSVLRKINRMLKKAVR